MSVIAENIGSIKAKIAKVNAHTQLIAVSKNHDASSVRAAIAAGQTLFGENRVQEATAKFTQIKAEFPSIKLHLIGPLQTNKVKDALKLFDVIETLDREKLAREFAKHNAQQEFFIQVNIGNEPQKAGIAPEAAIDFFKHCTADLKLNVTGLMCIPPVDENPEPFFESLKSINTKLGTHSLKLSMGMSADYELAAAQGADFVRIGTAIFGERNS